MEKEFENNVNTLDKEIQILSNNFEFLDNKSEDYKEIYFAFKQIISSKNTKRIFKVFSESMDIAVSIGDEVGNNFIEEKWQSICTDFHRANLKSYKKCLKSNIELSKQLDDGRNYSVYYCENGLINCVSPIIIEGYHISNICVGQFLSEEPDLSFFRANAKKYGFDEKAYMKALGNVSVIDEKKVEKILLCLSEFSVFISSMALDNIRAMKLEKNYQAELNKELKEEIEKNRKKDQQLIEQSRLAQIGNMLSMIAHQWRQPLSAISMDANNMLLDISMGKFSSTISEEHTKSIVEQTQNLSETIDNFRNFFKPDKAISKVSIKDVIEQTLSMVEDSLKNNKIKLTTSFETEKQVDAYPRELMQVFVNIITNAKEALVFKKTKEAQINIRVYEDEKNIYTEVCDNGGSIDADILLKIFDPYFSTKNEKNAVGLSLYMSKMVVEEHLYGKLSAQNTDGRVCFIVELPK